MDDTHALYESRFSQQERATKERIWKILCREFFQQYVDPSFAVLDLGAGFCEFINNINCRVKYAVDFNKDTAKFAHQDVKVVKAKSWNLSFLPFEAIDLVFTSNFFEHLKTKDELLATLRETHRVLKKGGLLLVLQPNIKYLYREYWDFLDHHLPLSHNSMAEALALCGFQIKELRSKFLPYTTKSRFPTSSLLVKLYLKLPPAQAIFGKQMFIVAQRMAEEG